MTNHWYKYLNKELQYYLDKLILESFSQKQAINLAKNRDKAQILVALAIIYKKISELELKINYLEKTLQRLFPKKEVSEIEKKKQEAEVEAFIKNLVRGKKKKEALRTVEKSEKIKKELKEKIKKGKSEKNSKRKESFIKIAKSL